MCDPAKAKEAMPVDVYVGGVEHGELMGKKLLLIRSPIRLMVGSLIKTSLGYYIPFSSLLIAAK